MKKVRIARWMVVAGAVTWAGSYIAGKETLLEQFSAAGIVTLCFGLLLSTVGGYPET